jgi:hypothetical protein
MDKNTSPQPDTKMNVIGGGPGKPRRISRRILIITLIGVVLLGVAGYFIYRQITATIPANENSNTVIDVSGQIDSANEYPKGSYMWANLMLNAAIYAGSNGACQQASTIIDQVKSTKLDEGVDVGAAQKDVDENCHG